MLNICPRYTVLYDITYQSSSAGSPIHVTLIEIFATSQHITTNVCRLRRGQAPVVTSFLSKSTWLRTQAHPSPFDNFQVPTCSNQDFCTAKPCAFLCRNVTCWFATHWADARSAWFSVLTAMGRTWKDLPALAYSSPFVQRQDLISNKYVAFCFRKIHSCTLQSYHFRLSIRVALFVTCSLWLIHVINLMCTQDYSWGPENPYHIKKGVGCVGSTEISGPFGWWFSRLVDPQVWHPLYGEVSSFPTPDSLELTRFSSNFGHHFLQDNVACCCAHLG